MEAMEVAKLSHNKFSSSTSTFEMLSFDGEDCENSMEVEARDVREDGFSCCRGAGSSSILCRSSWLMMLQS